MASSVSGANTQIQPPNTAQIINGDPGDRNIPTEEVAKLVYNDLVTLVYGTEKDEALIELCKKRELYDNLAPVLWSSHGVITVILHEIIQVYPMLAPPTLNVATSNRVSNALQLLQCIASHPETHLPFLNTHILLYLYPFLNAASTTRPYEYLRLTSLGVIGALVKNDNPKVITFLLSTEIIPLCLRIIEMTSGISKTVALYIVLRILQDDQGLLYVCQTYERFFAVNQVLAIVVEQLTQQPHDSSLRLLKHVVMCYQRLTDDDRARHSLRDVLPEALRNGTFSQLLREDQGTKRLLNQLLVNINKDM